MSNNSLTLTLLAMAWLFLRQCTIGSGYPYDKQDSTSVSFSFIVTSLP